MPGEQQQRVPGTRFRTLRNLAGWISGSPRQHPQHASSSIAAKDGRGAVSGACILFALPPSRIDGPEDGALCWRVVPDGGTILALLERLRSDCQWLAEAQWFATDSLPEDAANRLIVAIAAQTSLDDMTGAGLLGQVRRLYPSALRVQLPSGEYGGLEGAQPDMDAHVILPNPLLETTEAMRALVQFANRSESVRKRLQSAEDGLGSVQQALGEMHRERSDLMAFLSAALQERDTGSGRLTELAAYLDLVSGLQPTPVREAFMLRDQLQRFVERFNQRGLDSARADAATKAEPNDSLVRQNAQEAMPWLRCEIGAAHRSNADPLLLERSIECVLSDLQRRWPRENLQPVFRYRQGLVLECAQVSVTPAQLTGFLRPFQLSDQGAAEPFELACAVVFAQRAGLSLVCELMTARGGLRLRWVEDAITEAVQV